MTSLPELSELHEAYHARPANGVVNLAGYDTNTTPFNDSEADAEDDVDGDFAERLFDLHELLFAEAERSVLLVLQGTDCSGKNGTIKHVIISMNPAGVQTSSFVKPTEEELEHHFLWRVRQEVPKAGQLGVFDRSHYEDLVIPMAMDSLDAGQLDERADEINEFEKALVDTGTIIVKCFLHISYDEQRQRFLRRLRRDDKRWKFTDADLERRRYWGDFQAAYGKVLGRTSTDHAPWHVIPADHKWYRNWAIASLLIRTFEAMDLSYPQPDFDLDSLRQKLEAPN